MMKIKMHGKYDHFPNHNPLPFEPYIDCYNDVSCFTEIIEPNSIALLIEPRSLQYTYEWMEQRKHWRQFKYIFTHDSRLLESCPNAKRILWGRVYDTNDIPKTKMVSMVSSDKEYCWLHKARKITARELYDNPDVDILGTIDGGDWKSTREIYAPYRFSVAFENYIDDYWFTEKICNCFANKTIPIYFGAKKITDFFNKDGIIRVPHHEDIPAVIDTLKWQGFERQYELRRAAIEDNFERVKKFADFETWFFNEYGELLEGMNNEEI